MHHAELYAVMSTILINEQMKESRFKRLRKRAAKKTANAANRSLALVAGEYHNNLIQTKWGANPNAKRRENNHSARDHYKLHKVYLNTIIPAKVIRSSDGQAHLKRCEAFFGYACAWEHE